MTYFNTPMIIRGLVSFLMVAYLAFLAESTHHFHSHEQVKIEKSCSFCQSTNSSQIGGVSQFSLTFIKIFTVNITELVKMGHTSLLLLSQHFGRGPPLNDSIHSNF